MIAKLRGYIYSITLIPAMAALSLSTCTSTVVQSNESTENYAQLEVKLTLSELYGEYGAHTLQSLEIGPQTYMRSYSVDQVVANGTNSISLNYISPFTVAATENLTLRFRVKSDSEKIIRIYEKVYNDGISRDFAKGATAYINLLFTEPTATEEIE